MVEVVIDTNFLITFLTTPPTALEARRQEDVRSIFQKIEDNDVTGLLPEVVLHEMFYTMLGSRFPETQLTALCAAIREILTWSGWRFAPGDADVYVRALDILEAHPKLEFSDAVIAARAEAHDAELATFDKRLAKAYGGTIWADS